MKDQWRPQCFRTERLPPVFSLSSQPSDFVLNIHNPHETTRGGRCFGSGWHVPFSTHPGKIEWGMKTITTIYYKNWIFSGKKLTLQSTYLLQGVSVGLTKLGPFLLANAVFFTNSVVHTVLVGCKCSFPGQIRFKLSQLLADSLKYLLLCPTIRSFRDIKFHLTKNKLGFIVSKL